MKARGKPVPIEYHQIVLNTHVKRFHEFYYNYFNQQESRDLVTFFFEKIYNLEGKKHRDEVAQKTYRRFKALLSEKSRERIEKLLYLNEITDRLDEQMALGLMENPHWAAKAMRQGFIDGETYHELYRQYNRYEDRKEQLELVLWNLQAFFELSKHPLADMVMRPAYIAAAMVGAKDLYYVFEEGYMASKPVTRELFYQFLEVVKQKETQFLNSLYNRQE